MPYWKGNSIGLSKWFKDEFDYCEFLNLLEEWKNGNHIFDGKNKSKP